MEVMLLYCSLSPLWRLLAAAGADCRSAGTPIVWYLLAALPDDHGQGHCVGSQRRVAVLVCLASLTVDTSAGIVLDTQINVLIDAEACSRKMWADQ